VSATSFGRVIASQLAFLHGYALPFVASMRLASVTRTGGALSVPLQWRPSPGCRLGLLTVDLNYGNVGNVLGRQFDVPSRTTVSVTVPTGATVVPDAVGPTPAIHTGMQQQSYFHAARQSYCAFISLGDAGDVSDTIHDITVTIDDVAGEQHSGFAQVSLIELPLATLAPENGEPGVLLPSIDPRNDLHDGDTGAGMGLPEFLAAEQDAATRVREHFQVATYENTAHAWSRSSATVGALTWGPVGSVDPKFRVRVRAVYGTSANAAYALRIRYAATEDGTFRVLSTPVGIGATATSDDNFTATGGSWGAYEMGVSLRADGTEQEIDLQFHAATIDGSPVYISSIALIQTEVA
jgi:hypothetical protein